MVDSYIISLKQVCTQSKGGLGEKTDLDFIAELMKQSINIQKYKWKIPESPTKMHVPSLSLLYFYLHLDKMPLSSTHQIYRAPIIQIQPCGTVGLQGPWPRSPSPETNGPTGSHVTTRSNDESS